MKYSDFYKVLDAPEFYCTQEELYDAYMKKMEQFSEYAKIGPYSSFVMYPEGLRNDIWFYYVAYLSLKQHRKILMEQSDRTKYEKLLKEHKRIANARSGKLSFWEQMLVLIVSCFVYAILAEFFGWLWKVLQWLWGWIMNAWT